MGLVVRPATALSRWRDGKLTEEPPPEGSVGLNLVLFEAVSGRPVPGATATLELPSSTPGQPGPRVPLRPVLGPYDRYAGHAVLAPGEHRAKLQVRRPTFATLAVGAFDSTITAEIVLRQASARRSAPASSNSP